MEREIEQEVTIENLAGGGAAEMFAAALEQVAQNIADPNTEIGTQREVHLKLIIKPTARDQAMTKIRVQTKLAPAKDISTPMYFGKRDGKMVAVGVDLRQGNLFDRNNPSVTPIDRKTQES